MKRDPRLRALSDDHHRALVLAREAARAADSGSPAEIARLWRQLPSRFAGELEPHFRIEEERLLPPLLAVGEASRVERTRADHETLRRLVAAGGEGPELGRLAQLLHAHVRFEERELFPRAERLLPEADLEAVRSAAEGPRAACGARGPERP